MTHARDVLEYFDALSRLLGEAQFAIWAAPLALDLAWEQGKREYVARKLFYKLDEETNKQP